MSESPLRVCHLSLSDLKGGASRAAYRLHRALGGSGLDSTMRVALRQSDDPRVRGPQGKLAQGWAAVRPTVGALINRGLQSRNTVLHSASWLPSGLDRELNRLPVDVLHLHWVCGELLSVEATARLQKPQVWTLHDQWAFLGAEHYQYQDRDRRYQQGYRRDNRPDWEQRWDLNRWVWQRKQRCWRRPHQLVAPSRWMADCVARSVLLGRWPITVIPNALNTDLFRPWDVALSRRLLNLPPHRRLLLFGAERAGSDLRKGMDLLRDVLQRLPRDLAERSAAVILGQSAPRGPEDWGLPVHWLGPVTDERLLPLVYSAVDLTIVPSRLDNLPQIGTEAQACGCPVVAWQVGGLADVLAPEITGELVPPFDCAAMAAAIARLLMDEPRRRAYGEAARERAIACWAEPVVAGRYQSVYLQALGDADALS